MAPSHSRQLLIWTVPTTIVVILGYFWYRRKRPDSKRTDPGGAAPDHPAPAEKSPSKSCTPGMSCHTPTFSRSLSGVDSAPIDIVIPPKMKAAKSNPVVISDEDLDLEIEKIKSMRSGHSIDMRKSINCNEASFPKEFSGSPVVVKRSASPPPTPVMAEPVEKKKPSVQNLQVGSNETVQKPSSERDSANHSPADIMLASLSLSSISDNHSEGSSDSGKGGSEGVTPPPSRSLVATNGSLVATNGSLVVAGHHLVVPDSSEHMVVVYEFVILQQYVGKLIGKHGSSVTNIKEKTGALVVVRKHPNNNKMKICSVQGTQKEIDSAIKLIRDKFPLKRFPEVTLEQVSFLQPPLPLVPDHVQLKLIECYNNDTIVSCLLAPNHMFLQQPSHPSFANLPVLSCVVNSSYTQTDSPMMPIPVPVNTICVAFAEDGWYRVMVLSYDESNSTCYVKFLDYGGFARIDCGNLRQIRGDFLLLPFQAAECFLWNVKPIEETGWSEEAYNYVADMTRGTMTITHVMDETEDGIPLVNCYVVLEEKNIVLLNADLVKQGHAAWINKPEAAAVVPV